MPPKRGEAQVCYQSFELPVLLAQLPQLRQLRHTHTGKLAAPGVEYLLADAHLAADLGDRSPSFGLSQSIGNLLICVPFQLYRSSFSEGLRYTESLN